MKRSTPPILFMLLAVAGWTMPALAQTVFTIEDPPVDFEVIDAEPFDGQGDNGPYSTFNDVVLGTIGAARSMAEFDISPFSLPPGELISSARFEVKITGVGVYGLGVNGEAPGLVAADGYVGNGLDQLSDFEAGDGNQLDTVPLPDPWVGQVLSFDVTSFVADMVAAAQTYVGLTARAGTFGGLWVTEGNGYPKLIIETQPAEGVAEQGDPSAMLWMRPNVPNPFTRGTRIDYAAPSDGADAIVLTIHDASGRLIRALEGALQGSGIRSAFWDGTDRMGAAVPGGVYFCRLSCGGRSETRPMLLVR
jgi:hypothetical protein